MIDVEKEKKERLEFLKKSTILTESIFSAIDFISSKFLKYNIPFEIVRSDDISVYPNANCSEVRIQVKNHPIIFYIILLNNDFSHKSYGVVDPSETFFVNRERQFENVIEASKYIINGIGGQTIKV